jgi:Flp pilus assembly protein TadG
MLRIAHRFAKARDGIAAVEFALIAPVMILLFFGAADLFSALDCNARVSRVGYTVADLVAQSTSVGSTDTTNFFNAATAILYPYAATNAKIVVSSITYDTKGKLTVAWSDPYNTTKRATAPSTFPTGVMLKDASGNIIPGSVIYAEITYSFSAPVTYFLGPITLKNSFYTKPRRSTVIAHS